jgi:hypothetical protein
MPILGLCRAGSRVSDEITPYSAGCADFQDSNAVDSRGLIRRARPIEGVYFVHETPKVSGPESVGNRFFTV